MLAYFREHLEEEIQHHKELMERSSLVSFQLSNLEELLGHGGEQEEVSRVECPTGQ